MLPRFYLTPATKPAIKDPKTMARMPEAGAYYPMNSYWLRRVKAGDVNMKLKAPKVAEPAKVEVKKGSK